MLKLIHAKILTTGSGRITNFSHAKYILVLDGNVLVWEHLDLIRH